MNLQDDPAIPDTLTEREQTVLRLLAQGLTDREIAETLVLTVGTVKWYNRQIYNKLSANNRTEAVTRARQLGLLDTHTSPASAKASPPLRHNLPAQLTSFVGRSRELAKLNTLLDSARLVTLTGPPGAGKTRLALRLAEERADQYQDGVFFVSLAPLSEAALVVQSIAQALRLSESGQASLLKALSNHIQAQQLLMVLDNFEHVLPAAPLIADLLSAAPELSVLVSSRERLGLYGEQEFVVAPLTVPDLDSRISLDQLRRAEAVDLFVQRAQAVSTGFELNLSNAEAVALICNHVDGLPLALELAAARCKFYSPQSLLLRLSSRLEALSSGPRDFPARQRALRSTLNWSYDLLDANEQRLFALLAVFAGSWSLEDAQAVCGDDTSLPVTAGLESLVNKSLVQQWASTGDLPRYMFLETMREYGLEKLAASGEQDLIRERHARYYFDQAEVAAQEIYGPDGSAWVQWMTWEHDNLRTALRWHLNHAGTDRALQFVARLCRFWDVRGHLSEGLSWLAEALGLPAKVDSNEAQKDALHWLTKALDSTAANPPSKARADALNGGGDLAYLQSNYDLTRLYYRKALEMYETLGDQAGRAHALIGLGEVATEIGDYESAPVLFQRAFEIIIPTGDLRSSARVCTQLGWAALRVGDYENARTWMEDGLAFARRAEDKVGISLVLSGLGEIAIRENDLDQATVLLEESLQLRRELGIRWGIATSLGSLAWVQICRHEYGQAIDMLRQSVVIRQDISDIGGIAWCLEKRAEIALQQKDSTLAVQIFAAAAGLRTSVNSVADPSDQDDYSAMLDSLAQDLGSEAFAAAWTAGSDMRPDQVLPLAFPETDFDNS